MAKNISIVIPTFNRINTLKKVLPSYLKQKGLKEIVIVDDASTDGTGKYLTDLMKTEDLIVYKKNRTNKGASATLNIAIQNSKGKYVFLCEDDVELTPNYLPKLLDSMKREKADMMTARLIEVRVGEKKREALRRADKLDESQLIDYKLILVNFQAKAKSIIPVPICNGVMLVKREVFKTMKYDENYKKNYWREETDFQISALESGFKIYYNPFLLAYHFHKKNDSGGCHTQTILKREYWIIRNNYYFTRKHRASLSKIFSINNIFIYLFRFVCHRMKGLFLIYASLFKRKILGLKDKLFCI